MLKSVSEKISKIQYASVWEEAVFKSTKVLSPAFSLRLAVGSCFLLPRATRLPPSASTYVTLFSVRGRCAAQTTFSENSAQATGRCSQRSVSFPSSVALLN